MNQQVNLNSKIQDLRICGCKLKQFFFGGGGAGEILGNLLQGPSVPSPSIYWRAQLSSKSSSRFQSLVAGGEAHHPMRELNRQSSRGCNSLAHVGI